MDSTPGPGRDGGYSWRTLQVDITREVKIKLMPNETFGSLLKTTRENPKLVETVLSLVKNKKRISCPFPFECKEFPCKDLYCNADMCTNGYSYRMS